MIEIKPIFTLKEAASLLNLSKPTIYRAIASQKLPAVKIFGRTMIRREALEAFISDLPDAVGTGAIRASRKEENHAA